MNDNADSANTTDAPDHPGAGFGTYLRLCIGLGLMLVLLFWPAGTIDWRRGWLFYSILVALAFFGVSWIDRENPELFAARRRIPAGARPRDALIPGLVSLAWLAILPLAALDDARFQWAPVDVWVQLAGYVLLIAGFMGITWAQASNRHFEPAIRIQAERKHTVVEAGPYAFIRHPGYAFAVPAAAGTALSLGSFVALAPVALLCALLAYRTVTEDRFLRDNLPGYVDYATRVKWRWLPGLW